MSAVKIGPKHQITIPKEIFKKLHLQTGEWVEAVEQGGKIVLIPKQLTDKPPVPRLNKEEQRILAKAKEKIDKINKDLSHSVGLNDKEIKVAIKVGLINQDQAWWWHEDWQKKEREAERDLERGDVYGPYDNIKDALRDLKKAKI